MIKNKAYSNDAYEALLIRDGFLTEGSASNVFIIKDGIIKTPSYNKLLPRNNQEILTDLICSNNLKYNECDISHDDLLMSDEIFCSSSTNPVVPIIQVDNHTISKQAGPLTMKLYNIAQSYIKSTY